MKLSPEDEQAVRLRTGYMNPGSSHYSVFSKVGAHAHVEPVTIEEAANAKRKAEAIEKDGEGGQ